MDEFSKLMRDITDRQLAMMGLPPLPVDRSNNPVQVGSPLWERLRNRPYAELDFHDHCDRGDPLEKLHPDPRHWSRWPERTDFDEREP